MASFHVKPSRPVCRAPSLQKAGSSDSLAIASPRDGDSQRGSHEGSVMQEDSLGAEGIFKEHEVPEAFEPGPAGQLRAVPLGVAMHMVGRVFGNSGSFRRNVSLETWYAQSVPVEHVDVFVSHAWRESRLLKFLSLALHFRLNAATLSSQAAALLLLAIQMTQLLPFPVFDERADSNGPDLRCGLACSCVPPVVFVSVLFLGTTGCNTMMFIDRCCIYWTDHEHKKFSASTTSLSLRRSRQMLLLWSSDYLKRLWCVYEATVFLQFRSAEGLCFIPVHRAAALLTIFTLQVLRAVLASSYSLWKEDFIGEKPRIRRLIILADSLVYLTCYAYFIVDIRHTRQRQPQLSTFSAHGALCSVEGDRALIHKSIADSHSAAALLSGGPPPFDTSSSIDIFDEDARARLGQALERAAGAHALLPYSLAVFVAQPVAWTLLDRVAFAPLDQSLRLLLLAAVRAFAYVPLWLRLWQLGASFAAGFESRSVPWAVPATAASAAAVALDALLSRALGSFFVRATSAAAVCAAAVAFACVATAVFVPRKHCEREVRISTPQGGSPGYSVLSSSTAPTPSPFSREPAEEAGFGEPF